MIDMIVTDRRDLNKHRCIIKGCRSIGRVRGLCLSHYNRFRKLVNSKLETWKSLERYGIANPPKRRKLVDRSTKIKNTIKSLHKLDIYPSVRRICSIIESSRPFTEKEKKIRDATFKKLGIKMRHFGDTMSVSRFKEFREFL